MTKILKSSAALACFAALCPAAAVAAPFTLTSVGGSPEVAVDFGGNGHFVWNEGKTSEPDVTHYCRIPPGGTTCAVSHAFVPTGDSATNNTDFDGPHIFVTGSTVVVMTSRCCGGFPPAGSDGIVIYISTDNGQTFGAQQVVGDANTQGNAILGPGARLSTISDVVTGGTFYQTQTPGTFTSGSANLGDSGPSQAYSGSLALFDPSTPIATFDDLETTFWRLYGGSGDYNDIANWLPTQTVGPGEDGELAHGPAGVWLLYLTGEISDQTFVARAFTGTGWGTPVDVSETGNPIFADFHQDPSGRHHAVWLDGSRDLMYRRADDGATYGPTTQLAESDFRIFHLEVAAGSDGEGWVVWDANSNTSDVRAAALEVVPERPVLGESVAVEEVAGEVFVSLPDGAGSARASQKGADFIPLTEARSIPVRSILDTRKGTVALRAARNSAGKTQSGQFSAGVFQVLQSRKPAAKGLTTLRMKGSKAAFKRCGSGKGSANAALTRRQIRRLRARARGRYRTSGRYSAATVRGTTWTVTDSCAGTLTTVKRGKVAVRDFRKKKTVVVPAGKSYFAKAPGG